MAVISGEVVRETVCAFVRSRAQGHPEEYTVEFLSVPDSVVLPEGGCAAFVNDPGIRIFRGALNVEVEFRKDDRVEGRCSASFVVRTHRMVLVAARTLDRNMQVTASDVREQWMETTELPEEIIVGMDQLAGMRTRRIVTEGSVIPAGALEPVPLVMHGQVVRLVVRRGPVTLSTQAIARADGRRGEIIPVQQMGTHGRLKAKVTDAQTVELISE
jgi:flagella basal body P-ring formation protein FlgA